MTLWEAQLALRDYMEQAREAAGRRAAAESVLDQTPAVAELFDPSGAARERAQAARGDIVRARVALDEAAARLAVRLAALEELAALPPPGLRPCAPPPPSAPLTGWARVADFVFGSGESGLYDPFTCEPLPLLEAGSGAFLRGLAQTQAKAATREQLIARTAADLLADKNSAHAFSHSDMLFGRPAMNRAEREVWARLIAAGLQSEKVFTYSGTFLKGVGRLHTEHGHRWVIVQKPDGSVASTFIPSRRQYAAILRELRKGG
ncbi:MAG: hypothetical protein KY451_06285 [Actinobacteria bacterium]|nr:hypothetical protein [Actinomycetota bacterium]